MKTHLVLASGLICGSLLVSQAYTADQTLLQIFADQVRGRTARLVHDTNGYFGDAANFKHLDSSGRAMHACAEAMATLTSATEFQVPDFEKDLGALRNYRGQYSRELDVLELKLQELWAASYKGSFVAEDVAILRFRLAGISLLESAIKGELHPSAADLGATLPGLSSRPCPFRHDPIAPSPLLPERSPGAPEGGAGSDPVAPPAAPPSAPALPSIPPTGGITAPAPVLPAPPAPAPALPSIPPTGGITAPVPVLPAPVSPPGGGSGSSARDIMRSTPLPGAYRGLGEALRSGGTGSGAGASPATGFWMPSGDQLNEALRREAARRSTERGILGGGLGGGR